MVAEILSQDEINALLEQAGGIAVGGESAALPPITEPVGPPPKAKPEPETETTSEEEIDIKTKIKLFSDLPIRLSVEVGRNILKLKQILQLGKNSIVELSKLKDEPVDILINGQKIAEGEVVIIDDNFGVKILRFLEDSEIIEFLNKYKRD